MGESRVLLSAGCDGCSAAAVSAVARGKAVSLFFLGSHRERGASGAVTVLADLLANVKL